MWTLKDRACLNCGTFSLLLTACPGCSNVILACAECQQLFTDVKATTALSGNESCERCGNCSVEAFSPATGEQVQSAGWSVSEYA
jgi:hypothetical protein